MVRRTMLDVILCYRPEKPDAANLAWLEEYFEWRQTPSDLWLEFSEDEIRRQILDGFDAWQRATRRVANVNRRVAAAHVRRALDQESGRLALGNAPTPRPRADHSARFPRQQSDTERIAELVARLRPQSAVWTPVNGWQRPRYGDVFTTIRANNITVHLPEVIVTDCAHMVCCDVTGTLLLLPDVPHCNISQIRPGKLTVSRLTEREAIQRLGSARRS